MDVSVIIVNYNTKQLTSECINSVFDKTKGVEFEVILVDNGSTDGSKELFEQDKRITYIYSKENLGFGRANNLGYSHATGDYLFLLNSDTFLRNNAIYILWSGFDTEFQKSHNVSCAGCMLRDVDNEIVHSYARFPSKTKCIIEASLYVILWKLHLLKTVPTTSNYDYSKNYHKQIFDVDYITGADLMIRKTYADKYGLFDPEFFMYSEETEMEFRYMKHGLRRIIIVGPEIVHLEGKSNSKYSPARKTMVLKSRFLYFKKTTPKILYYVFNLIYKVAYLLTLLICFPFVHGSTRDKLYHAANVLMM